MQQTYILYAIVGALVLALSVAAAPIKRQLWVSEPMLAMLVGVLLGPSSLSVLTPTEWGNSTSILEELARLTQAISLMGVALRSRRPIPWLLAPSQPASWRNAA